MKPTKNENHPKDITDDFGAVIEKMASAIVALEHRAETAELAQQKAEAEHAQLKLLFAVQQKSLGILGSSVMTHHAIIPMLNDAVNDMLTQPQSEARAAALKRAVQEMTELKRMLSQLSSPNPTVN